MTRAFSSVIPSLRTSNINWTQQLQQQYTQVSPNVIVTAIFGYKVQTAVVVTAIMEWNIGVPFPSGQIRQTAQDRMDFAY